MDQNTILEDLLTIARDNDDPAALDEATLASEHPDLLHGARQTFGSWSHALAAALIRQTRVSARPAIARSAPRPSAPRPPRILSPDHDRPALWITTDGHVLRTTLDTLRVTDQPEWLPLPEGPADTGPPLRLVPMRDDASLALFTDRGNGVRLDLRLVPDWAGDAPVRPLHYRFRDCQNDEHVQAAMLLGDIRDHQRLHFLTTGGQIKISDTPEYRGLDSAPLPSVILRDDFLLAAFAGPTRRVHVLVASSAGKAIHFDTTDIRSQGRKAGGVRAIALDDDATVVGAFPTQGVEEIALVTARGFAKRMSMDDFRPQGRAGGGLQTVRLDDDDEVVALTPIDPGGDILIHTRERRFMRLPAWDLPPASRAARGDQLAAPLDDDALIGAIGLPSGSA
ncbi:MAG: hypothetical protein EA398_12210 [Deltaproteobacteria bacterium]|nr:MAG: hypothetical protein EA398_12210 [Deltaproteobacteria bacterium]